MQPGSPYLLYGRKFEKLAKKKNIQTAATTLLAASTLIFFSNFLGFTSFGPTRLSRNFPSAMSLFKTAGDNGLPNELAPWEDIYDVTEALTSSGRHVTLIGNCHLYIKTDPDTKTSQFTGNVLQFHDIAEQLTSALLPLHSVMRMANATRRVLVGPYVTSQNRYSSFPDIPADADTLAKGRFPPSFVTQFWDISPLFRVYQHLCLVTHQFDAQDTCQGDSRMTIRISPAVNNDSWATPTYRELKPRREIDLTTELLDRNQPWSETQCVYYRGSSRSETHGDPMMRVYNGPNIPHPTFYRGSENAHAEFAKNLISEYSASERAIGVRLFTFFTPSLRIVHLASKLTQWVSASEKYIGVHLRLERVYNLQAGTGPFSEDCSKLSNPDEINPCVVRNCPPEDIVKEITNQIGDLRESKQLRYPKREKWSIFVARDFGKRGGSSTLANSSLAVDQYESLLPLASVGSLLIEYSSSHELDPSTAGLVDLLLLSDATDCVQVGRGSFNSLVNFYRQSKGRTACQVLQRTPDFGSRSGDQPCRLQSVGRSVLIDDASWRVILGTTKNNSLWQDLEGNE